jgi:hypothetical protein
LRIAWHSLTQLCADLGGETGRWGRIALCAAVLVGAGAGLTACTGGPHPEPPLEAPNDGGVHTGTLDAGQGGGGGNAEVPTSGSGGSSGNAGSGAPPSDAGIEGCADASADDDAGSVLPCASDDDAGAVR